MKNSKILKCLSVLAFLSCVLVLPACGDVETPSVGGEQTSETQSTNNGGQQSNELITAVTAKADEIVLKLGSFGDNLKNYYKVESPKGVTLSGAQQKCDYKVADTEICSLVSTSTIKPNKVGETTVTITSKIDATKSCTIKVVVKDSYFDMALSTDEPMNDMSKELPADGAIVQTKSEVTTDLYIKDLVATKWYAECKFALNSVSATEYWPKLGIVTKAANGLGNRLYYFLDAAIGDNGNSTWTNFGVCEVADPDNWAWNPNITNDMARHNDACFSSETSLTYGSEFTLGLLRDGDNFHLFYNDVYKCTVQTLYSLFNDTATGESVPTHVGFFEFNSDATFSQYTATTADEAVVNAKLDSISSLITINNNWAED